MLILQFKVEEKKGVEEKAPERTAEQNVEVFKTESQLAGTVYGAATSSQVESLDAMLTNPTKTTVKEGHEALSSTISEMDNDKFNEIRELVGLEKLDVEHINNPKLKASAVSETAEAVREQMSGFVHMIGETNEKISHFEAKGNTEDAEQLKHDLSEVLGKTTTIKQADEEFMKKVEEYKAKGRTELAHAIDDVMASTREFEKGLESGLEAWGPEDTFSDLTPVPLFAAEGMEQYSQQLISNINDFLEHYVETVNSSENLNEEEKNELMTEAKEAESANKNLSEDKMKDARFREIFEKNLKEQMESIKANITDVETLSQISKIESGKVELTSDILLLQNMHPSVVVGVLRAYRASIDEATALA